MVESLKGERVSEFKEEMLKYKEEIKGSFKEVLAYITSLHEEVNVYSKTS